MSQRVTVSIVGLDSGAEHRTVMALQLLAASGIRARVMPWDGTRRDIVIADIDDAYGRSALALVRRRGGGALSVSRLRASSDDTTVALTTTQVAELARRIRTVVASASGTRVLPEKPAAGGLLQLCIEHGDQRSDLLARNGPFSVIVRREASRIMAASHSDLATARTRLLSDAWTAETLGSHGSTRAHSAVTQSLDAFLIEACEGAERDLPALDGDRHRLESWPDLGSIPDNTHALRMSSALVRASWSVDALADHCDVERARANAFCWATRASGLLTSDHAVSSERTATRSSDKVSRSLLSRLARRFNLSLGTER